MKALLQNFSRNNLQLKNRIVMAPMTRSRAINNIPNELMATYYRQRSDAGLIITEGTAPSPDALGYARIPGIFNQQQVDGWKKTTEAVHQNGAKIFLQLMHTGRIGHVDNLPEGARLVGASDQKAAGQIFTDTKQMQDFSEPVALTTEAVKEVVNSFVTAAKNAIKAGFDGVELHGANGYLLEQFLNPHINTRADEYGGSMENRSRLTLEIAQETALAIGKEKVGIRFSPYSTLGDLPAYDSDEVHQTYSYLADKLNEMGIAYIHISANPGIPQKTYDAIRANFSNIIILCNGLTPETAEVRLGEGFSDLIAFGRNFLANPDLVKRIEIGAELNQPDYNTLYTPGEKGYTNYPVMAISTTE